MLQTAIIELIPIDPFNILVFNPDLYVIDESLPSKERATAFVEKASLFSDLRRNKDAITFFNNAIMLNPKNVDAYLGRGFSKISIYDYSGAKADFKKSAKLNLNLTRKIVLRAILDSSIIDDDTFRPLPKYYELPPKLPSKSKPKSWSNTTISLIVGGLILLISLIIFYWKKVKNIGMKIIDFIKK